MDRRFHSIEDLTHMPPPSWLVEGMFEVNTVVMLAGPPGSYKSFMALDWMLCIATGRQWLGRRVRQQKVLYLLGEGKASLLKRTQAWDSHNTLSASDKQALQDNFRVTFEVTQFASRANVDKLLKQLEDEGFTPDVIVIDTFARSYLGLDENLPKDIGPWIEQADRLRHLGYTVLFLHHTAKNTEAGFKFRGSTALEGAVDTSFIMHKAGGKYRVKFLCVKQKDHDEGDPLYFDAKVVNMTDKDEGSIVLVYNADAKKVAPIPEFESGDMQADMEQVFADPELKTDALRARALCKKFPNMTETAAKNRISRYKKRKERETVH